MISPATSEQGSPHLMLYWRSLLVNGCACILDTGKKILLDVVHSHHMHASIDLNGEVVEFKRNWFTGHFTYTHRGKIKVIQSGWHPGTHISFRLTKRFTVTINQDQIEIVKNRPLFNSGFRPHRYEFFVNGNKVYEIKEK